MSLASPVEAPHDPYAPLRIGNFRWFVASILTMAMCGADPGGRRRLADVRVTRDPLALGMVGLAEAAPFIALRALRRPRRRRARPPRRMALHGAGACCSPARWRWPRPARCSSPRAAVARALSFSGVIYAIIVVCGVARSFLLPARNALGADLVPRALFPSAVAWRTGIWQVAAVTGRRWAASSTPGSARRARTPSPRR